MATALWAIIAMAIVSVGSALATFFLKLAAPKMTFSPAKLFRVKNLWIGLFLYGGATVLSLFALRAGELSILYPFVALQYIWASLLSMKYLGEKMGVLKWAGVVLIFLGVVLVGLGA
jgi:drug/metabolite transporter (DMT)-like permease